MDRGQPTLEHVLLLMHLVSQYIACVMDGSGSAVILCRPRVFFLSTRSALGPCTCNEDSRDITLSCQDE